MPNSAADAPARARRCVFLDRDGVINAKAPEGDYVKNWAEFRFLPGISDWIRLFNALDFLVIVVTNQRGVARGRMRLEDLEEIHRRMREELARGGARLDDVFVCLHEEGECSCRKPRTGLVEEAQKRWNIDIAASLSAIRHRTGNWPRAADWLRRGAGRLASWMWSARRAPVAADVS